jgi:hypothetical protein
MQLCREGDDDDDDDDDVGAFSTNNVTNANAMQLPSLFGG